MKYLIALICLLLCTVPAIGQEPTVDDETAERLEWLKKFVGEWEVDYEGAGTAKLTCTMLGDHWVINDMQTGTSTFSVRGLQTIGYDPKSKKYIGTWVDSMTGYMWHYEGEVDESGNKIILAAEGPSMTDPDETAMYRDAYEFKSADHILATASVQNEDGEWTTFMSGNAYRAEEDDD